MGAEQKYQDVFFRRVTVPSIANKNLFPFFDDFNPLGPDESYMIHGPYGRNNCPGTKGLKLIDPERSISIQRTN